MTTTIMTFAIYYFNFYADGSNMLPFWLAMTLYGTSIIALCCVMTAFFDKAKTAGKYSSEKVIQAETEKCNTI